MQSLLQPQRTDGLRPENIADLGAYSIVMGYLRMV